VYIVKYLLCKTQTHNTYTYIYTHIHTHIHTYTHTGSLDASHVRRTSMISLNGGLVKIAYNSAQILQSVVNPIHTGEQQKMDVDATRVLMSKDSDSDYAGQQNKDVDVTPVLMNKDSDSDSEQARRLSSTATRYARTGSITVGRCTPGVAELRPAPYQRVYDATGSSYTDIYTEKHCVHIEEASPAHANVLHLYENGACVPGCADVTVNVGEGCVPSDDKGTRDAARDVQGVCVCVCVYKSIFSIAYVCVYVRVFIEV
jgi:hypothetical protein